jgi:phthalate 4,5-dioxygenase oxygenase subunit
VDREDILPIMGLDDHRFWNSRTCDFTVDWADHLGQSRDQMGTNWSGYSGIEQEDAVLAVSMGPIVDRSQEHLVPADVAVVRLRRRLLEAVKMVERGEEPPGNDIADYCRVRCLADTVIKKGDNWRGHVPGNRQPKAEAPVAA